METKTETKSEIKENLLQEIYNSNLLIKETETNSTQFVINIKNSLKSNLLQSIINQISEQEKYLGEKVHFIVDKNKNDILTRVISKKDFEEKNSERGYFNHFYSLDNLEFIYSQNELNIFIEDLIKKRIESIQHEMCNGQLCKNSSSPISNLIYSWERETEQEIYKYLNNLIGNFML